MAARYTIDPARGRFTVRAFATGALSVFGHSPTFTVRGFSGALSFEGGEVGGMALELVVEADSLELQDRVSAHDRGEIEGRMRREVLETSAFPEVVYRAVDVAEEAVARGRYRLRIVGRLSLHGVTLDHPIVAELRIFEDGVQLRGECPLRMSDYRIRPVTALGGTIRLKDEVRLTFDIVARPPGP